VLFDTDCLWLSGYKPSESIADAESIARVYRGGLQPDVDGMTRNLGTTVAVPNILGMGQPAADETAVGRSGRSTASAGKPRTLGRTAVGSRISRIV
jgi:hypothetical protein